MSTLTDVAALVTAAPVHVGYPDTAAALPYVVTRPLAVLGTGVVVCGDETAWDHQYSLYCCGASVEASYNLALMVMNSLQGKRVGGSTISVYMGYAGAPVEGHYESQVTAQLFQGGNLQ